MIKMMQKKLLVVVTVLFAMFFSGCVLDPSIDAAIEIARTQVNCRYESRSGKIQSFSWHYPAEISGKIERFFISENPAPSSNSSLTCLKVENRYRHKNYDDSVSIDPKFSKVEPLSKNWSSTKSFYLWAELKSGKKYNLGQFQSSANK